MKHRRNGVSGSRKAGDPRGVSTAEPHDSKPEEEPMTDMPGGRMDVTSPEDVMPSGSMDAGPARHTTTCPTAGRRRSWRASIRSGESAARRAAAGSVGAGCRRSPVP